MAIQNLDEMIARAARQGSAPWGKDYLEGATPGYYWQPETLTYIDTVTGHEVTVLMRTPNGVTEASSEYASNLWSFDGSRVSAWVPRTKRLTANASATVGAGVTYVRFICNADGSKLRACEKPGNCAPGDDPSWANTELAYYCRGDAVSHDGGETYIIYKSSVDANNIVSPVAFLNCKTATGGDDTKGWATGVKNAFKKCISNDDSKMLLIAGTEINRGRTINCYGVIAVDMAGPTITSYWGMNRDCFQYYDHLQSQENRQHGGGIWGTGINKERITIQFSGGGHVFWSMLVSGSEADGGPDWQNWDGDSYGINDIIPISSGWNSAVEPEGTYHPYWGHPTVDKWEEYILFGDGDPYPGTKVFLHDVSGGLIPWESATPTTNLNAGFVDTNITSVRSQQYDGRHHSWNAWSDHVVFFPYKVSGTTNGHRIMYGSKLNFDAGTHSAYAICETQPNTDFAPSNYSEYARPSQSPDGTKVLFHAGWLNYPYNTTTGSGFPDVRYAVAYFPYPATITGATRVSGKTRLAFNPPYYSTRTYGGNPVEPKEIKYWHVWVSDNGTTGWTELTDGSPVAFATRTYDATQANDTTKYYAITSEEHSRLESRCLGNIWKVIVDAGGTITSSVEQTAYPADPGASDPFWTTAPGQITNLTVTAQASSYHKNVTWTEPAGNKIRYYNIYYSTSANPTAVQTELIASVPVGTSSYYDWCADAASSTHYYGITTVDRQGNESAIVTNFVSNFVERRTAKLGRRRVGVIV